MPTYDYECTKCKHKFEMRQGFDADPIQMCPVCKSISNRKFHSVAIIYKGSGFYTTDYARKNVLPAESSDDSKSVDETSSKKKKKDSPKESSKETSENGA